jgi:hypothetical protein
MDQRRWRSASGKAIKVTATVTPSHQPARIRHDQDNERTTMLAGTASRAVGYKALT